MKRYNGKAVLFGKHCSKEEGVWRRRVWRGSIERDWEIGGSRGASNEPRKQEGEKMRGEEGGGGA